MIHFLQNFFCFTSAYCVHGNPLQYSCLENPKDRGALWAIVHTVARSRTQRKPLSTHVHTGLIHSWSLNNVGVDSTNRRSYSTEVLTTEKNPRVSGPMQFQLILIKRQLLSASRRVPGIQEVLNKYLPNELIVTAFHYIQDRISSSMSNTIASIYLAVKQVKIPGFHGVYS